MAMESASIKFRAEVFEESDLYVALSPDLDVSSFGSSLDEARESLREAVEAFLEGCPSLGTLAEVLEEAGFRREGDRWVARERVSEEMLVARA